MKTFVSLTCIICKKPFERCIGDIHRGRNKFCSRICANVYHSGSGNPSYKHGHSPRREGQSKEYRTWAGVKERVLHGNELNRKYYKEAGIRMCDRWLNSFENFLLDMGPAPSTSHSIDRIDPKGHYEPGNCRWATHKEQMNNTSFNRRITYKGETLTQQQWAERYGLTGTIICKRLRRGWSIDEAFNTPRVPRTGKIYEYLGKKMTLHRWASYCKRSYQSFHSLFKRRKDIPFGAIVEYALTSKKK